MGYFEIAAKTCPYCGTVYKPRFRKQVTCARYDCEAKRQREVADAKKTTLSLPPKPPTIQEMMQEVKTLRTEIRNLKEEGASARAQVKKLRKVIADMREDY